MALLARLADPHGGGSFLMLYVSSVGGREPSTGIRVIVGNPAHRGFAVGVDGIGKPFTERAGGDPGNAPVLRAKGVLVAAACEPVLGSRPPALRLTSSILHGHPQRTPARAQQRPPLTPRMEP